MENHTTDNDQDTGNNTMEIIFVMLLGAVLNGLLASSRGRNPAGWALLGACFPLISLLILVLMPDLKASASTERRLSEEQHQRQLAELRTERAISDAGKTCPRCAETIKAAAVVCRFCGYEFPPDTKTIKEKDSYRDVNFTRFSDYSVEAYINGELRSFQNTLALREYVDNVKDKS